MYIIIHTDEQKDYIEYCYLDLQGLAERLAEISTPYQVIYNNSGHIEPLDGLEQAELWNLIKQERKALK